MNIICLRNLTKHRHYTSRILMPDDADMEYKTMVVPIDQVIDQIIYLKLHRFKNSFQNEGYLCDLGFDHSTI